MTRIRLFSIRIALIAGAVFGSMAVAACGGSQNNDTAASTVSPPPPAPVKTAATPSKSPSETPGRTPKGSGGAASGGGEAIFRQDCGRCHRIGVVGQGRTPLNHIGASHDAPWFRVQIRTPEQHHSQMPAFGPDKLSDKDLKTLVDYLLTQK